MERSPCINQAACPLKDTKRGCFEDVHHRLFPKRNYRSGLAKQYRELPENKEQICRNEHNERHATDPIPVKPSTAEMRAAIAQSALRGAYEQPDMDAGVELLPAYPASQNLEPSMA